MSHHEANSAKPCLPLYYENIVGRDHIFEADGNRLLSITTPDLNKGGIGRFIVKAVNSHEALATHLLTSNEVLGRCAAQFEMLHRPDLADDCMAKAKANRAALALVEGGQ